MKKTFLSIFFFCLFSCVAFTSCSSLSFIRPVSTLLNPPLYYPEYEELVEAFEQDVKSDNQFCIPHEGEYNSAIVIENIDSDSEEEALIFYKNRTDTVAKMHYFDFDNGEWKTSGDFNGYETV